MEQSFERFTDKRVWSRAIRHLRKNDARMARVIDEYECKVSEPSDDHYGTLMSSILYQQLAGTAAAAIEKRFMALFDGRYPAPREFLSASEKRIRSSGVSPQKYSYIRDLCERVDDGRLELAKFSGMDDDRIVEELDEVRGIGRWTAEMFLMFSLGRVDVLPVDDYGIRKAVMEVYRLRRLPSKERLYKIGEAWRPYRSVASLYLWKVKDGGIDNW